MFDFKITEIFSTGYAVIAVIVIYCLGLIANILTDHMTDSDNSKKIFY